MKMNKLALKRKINVFDRYSLNAKEYQEFLAKAFGLMAQAPQYLGGLLKFYRRAA